MVYTRTNAIPTCSRKSNFKATAFSLLSTDRRRDCTMEKHSFRGLCSKKTLHPLRGRLARDLRQDVILNAFTAPVCNCFSGLKIHSSNQYTKWSYNKSTFNAVHFHRNPFMCSCERDKQALMVSNLALLLDFL